MFAHLFGYESDDGGSLNSVHVLVGFVDSRTAPQRVTRKRAIQHPIRIGVDLAFAQILLVPCYFAGFQIRYLVIVQPEFFTGPVMSAAESPFDVALPQRKLIRSTGAGGPPNEGVALEIPIERSSVAEGQARFHTHQVSRPPQRTYDEFALAVYALVVIPRRTGVYIHEIRAYLSVTAEIHPIGFSINVRLVISVFFLQSETYVIGVKRSPIGFRQTTMFLIDVSKPNSRPVTRIRRPDQGMREHHQNINAIMIGKRRIAAGAVDVATTNASDPRIGYVSRSVAYAENHMVETRKAVYVVYAFSHILHVKSRIRPPKKPLVQNPHLRTEQSVFPYVR